MFTDNTVHKINKNNPAEMDRNGSKTYKSSYPISGYCMYKLPYFVTLCSYFKLIF